MGAVWHYIRLYFILTLVSTDFQKYRESGLTHLKSKTETNLPYYKELPQTATKPMINRIIEV